MCFLSHSIYLCNFFFCFPLGFCSFCSLLLSCCFCLPLDSSSQTCSAPLGHLFPSSFYFSPIFLIVPSFHACLPLSSPIWAPLPSLTFLSSFPAILPWSPFSLAPPGSYTSILVCFFPRSPCHLFLCLSYTLLRLAKALTLPSSPPTLYLN